MSDLVAPSPTHGKYEKFNDLENLRMHEIKEIVKHSCKLISCIQDFKMDFKQDKLLLMKYEACREDLYSIPRILQELIKTRENNIIG